MWRERAYNARTDWVETVLKVVLKWNDPEGALRENHGPHFEHSFPFTSSQTKTPRPSPSRAPQEHFLICRQRQLFTIAQYTKC